MAARSLPTALNKAFPGKFEVLSATSVGPKVGDDLRRQAVFATLYALGGMLVYIAFPIRVDLWCGGGVCGVSRHAGNAGTCFRCSIAKSTSR